MSVDPQRKEAFRLLLDYFPQLEPPISITSSSITEISGVNKALPYELLFEFVLNFREENEYREWIPVLSLPPDGDHYVLVLWELDVLTYTCLLATYHKDGRLLDHVAIAKLQADTVGDVSMQAAVIDEDSLIYTVHSDQVRPTTDAIDEKSTTIMEVLPNGKILKSLGQHDKE